MRKLPPPHIDHELPTRNKTRRAIVAVVLGLLLAPPIVEGSMVCAAQWRAMCGSVAVVKTPMLDHLAAMISSASFTVKTTAAKSFPSIPLRPAVVIPIACACGYCSCLLLRRR
jgi:hypothetical protein